jgi:hypothetical protein
MSDRDDFIEKRIKEETAKIQVDSYQKTASLGGWSGAGRTLWAIGTVGVVFGALVGLVAPFVPVLVTAAPLGLGAALGAAASAIPTSVATFAATGLATGFAGGLMLGRISGVSSAIAQEQERRLKAWTIENIIKENPNADIEHDRHAAAPEKKSFGQRVKDNYFTYFNPKVGLAMTLIGVVGGLIMGAAFLLTEGTVGGLSSAALETLTGLGPEAVAKLGVDTLASSAGVVLAYSAGVCGAFGALWNVNLTKITSEVTHFFGEIISGRLLGREWEPPQQLEKTSERALPAPAAPAQENTVAAESALPPHATVRQFTSYTELVAHPPAATPTLSR